MNLTHLDVYEPVDVNTPPTRLYFPTSASVRVFKAVAGNAADDVFEDITPTQIQYGSPGTDLYMYYIDVHANTTISTAQEPSESNYLVDGDSLLAIQGAPTATQDVNAVAYAIRIVSRTKTFVAEMADSTATSNPNSLVGRLLTVEKNQTDVLMPRLRRALGLLGEYQVADAFVYDDDGNITKCRIRIFNNQTDAEGAVVWLDTANELDEVPTNIDYTNGEVARYEINATNSLPRNLRTKFFQDLPPGPSQTISDQHFGKGGTSNGSQSASTNGSVM